MQRPRFSKRVLVAALVFLTVAAMVLWRGFSSSSSRIVKFADGRELIVRQLTYGTEHKFVTGGALARLVAPALPASLKGRFGVQTFSAKSDLPAVMVWGEWRREPKGNSLAPMLRVRDPQSGHRNPSKAGNWMSVRSGRYPAWQLKNFPRRDSILHIEVCEWDSSWRVKPVAELALPNPVAQKFPEWKAEPYPIVRQRNGLEFSMVNFSTGPFIADPWMSLMRHLQIATGYTAMFRVAENGRALDNWEIKQLIARDATGNVARSGLQPSVQIGDYLVFGLDETLWQSEKVWKFETHFTRKAGFESNELCKMTGISIPAPSVGAQQILASAKANGVELIGAELQRMRPGVSLQGMREDVEIEPLLPRTVPKRMVSLAAVKDDQGRELIHDRSYYNLDGMHFGIELLPDSRWLDLTFAVQEPVVIEFVGGLTERAGSVAADRDIPRSGSLR